MELYMSSASNGSATISEDIITQFGEDCKTSLRRQFSPKEKSTHIRISSIGKPLCQQQLAKAGAPETNKPYHFVMKMLLGDMVEAAVVAILRGAKVNVEGVQEQVTAVVNTEEVAGTLDIIIDGKVYDIKSASPYAFKNKFRKGFAAINEDDAFGYVPQGYLYAEAKGMPFGGWIAVNKSTGEVHVTETPPVDNAYRKQSLKTAETNIQALNSDAPFARCFEPIPETYYKKPTGNHILPINCQYCDFNKHCWGDKGVAYEFRESSKSKTGQAKWYVRP